MCDWQETGSMEALEDRVSALETHVHEGKWPSQKLDGDQKRLVMDLEEEAGQLQVRLNQIGIIAHQWLHGAPSVGVYGALEKIEKIARGES